MEFSATLRTDSGMHLVWDRAHFSKIRNYDTWEEELPDDLDVARHILQGHIVPINIQSDGTFAVTVRADSRHTLGLTALERARVLAASDPYRFECAGHIEVSGIEYVNAEPALGRFR